MGDDLLEPLPVVAPRDRRCRGWTLDNPLRRWWAPARTEVDLLSVRPGHRVVDMGAGVGYLAEALLDRMGPTGALDLVEPDPRSLEAVQARCGKDVRVRILQASAVHVPSIADQSADRVVLSLVLCCLVDKAGALDETWRILRPGGLALVTYPERRWRLSAQKASLRVSPELWDRLVVRHPWRLLSSSRQRLIRRQLIQKPEPAS